MQGIYNYTPEINHDSSVYNVITIYGTCNVISYFTVPSTTTTTTTVTTIITTTATTTTVAATTTTTTATTTECFKLVDYGLETVSLWFIFPRQQEFFSIPRHADCLCSPPVLVFI
jgi:hypothetical protein